MPGLDAELEATLNAAEAGFHVRSIATFPPDLLAAPAGEDAGAWLKAHGPDFDQFPVRDGEATVGVLLRNGDTAGKSVREAMQPLSEGIIVAADLPIADLIPMLRDEHFRLVLRRGKLDGLVTRSDFLKLPVRMYLFGVASHLEMCMREALRARLAWPQWFDCLERVAPKSGKAIRKQLKELEAIRLEPDPLELSTFADVIKVLETLPGLGEHFASSAERVRNLRNDVAHGKTYIGEADGASRLADTVFEADQLTRLVTDLARTNE